MKGLKKLTLLSLLSLVGIFSADVSAQKKRVRAEAAEKASSGSDENEDVGEAAASSAAGPAASKKTRTNTVEGCNESVSKAQMEAVVAVDDVKAGSESPIAAGADGIDERHASILPLEYLGVCASFLDSNSRQVLGESSLTMNQQVKPAVEVRFKKNTPKDAILSKLVRCPQVENINLGRCIHVTPALVQNVIQQCRKLKKLNLRGCKGAAGAIADLPEGVGVQLEELDLVETDATADQVRAIVQRCSPLKKLNIMSCSGAAGFIEGLETGAGEQLEELYLGSTDATAEQVRAIVQRCPQLKKLDLYNCEGAAGVIIGLSADVVLCLEELDLGNTGATPRHVSVIVQRCPMLKKLCLFGSRGSAGVMERLPEGVGVHLEELDLGCTGATAGQVRAIVERYPQLKRLSLNQCPGAGGFIQDFIKLKLEELDLGGTSATFEQVSIIVQQCPQLKKLNLDHCLGVAGAIAVLPESVVLPLEELNLGYTDATADQVKGIVQRCPQLKRLFLTECAGAAGFIAMLPVDVELKLEDVVLGGTGATAEQVRAILQRCPQLKRFSLNQCSGAAGFIEELSADVELKLEEVELRYTNATVEQVAAIQGRFPQCMIIIDKDRQYYGWY